MTYTLIHNPGCSTSRKGLALLQENGVEPTLRKYMNKSEQLSAHSCATRLPPSSTSQSIWMTRHCFRRWQTIPNSSSARSASMATAPRLAVPSTNCSR